MVDYTKIEYEIKQAIFKAEQTKCNLLLHDDGVKLDGNSVYAYVVDHIPSDLLDNGNVGTGEITLINGSVIKVVTMKDDWKEKIANGEGAKETDGKPNWDLVDLRVLEGFVAGLEYGCDKYAKDNWKKVPNPVENYYSAAIRHLAKWHAGEKADDESGLSHLDHAICNLYFLKYFELHPDEVVK